MFVLSILDGSDERNFLTTGVRVDKGHLLAEIGDVTHKFRICDVIDLILVDEFGTSNLQPSGRCARSARIN
jgi:hypothetical protein